MLAVVIFFFSWRRANNGAIIIVWEVVKVYSYSIEFPIFLDKIAVLFLFRVRVISLRVCIFAVSYMSEEKFFSRFYFLVFRFIFSIILLIVSPNIVSLILGWDGLGVSSYLLIIYFFNQKSLNSGTLTAISNRLGDTLIFISIALFFSLGSLNFFLCQDRFLREKKHLIIMIIILAATTKRAQIPFSAWLPAAIAAPTPVSSLVHSSTLVTAGVYVIIRFQELVAQRNYKEYLLIVGMLTIFLARISALFETDIKKIIALSTLSQLGLIIVAIGRGMWVLSFFHLLTHAYFKALIFITVGDLIHQRQSYQDLRKLNIWTFSSGTTIYFNVLANFRLIGVPFIAGHRSKDLIVEIFIQRNYSCLIDILFILSIAFTAGYSFRFIFSVFFTFSKTWSVNWRHDWDSFNKISMLILSPLAVAGGVGLSWLIIPCDFSPILPFELKCLSLVMIAGGVVFRRALRFSTIKWLSELGQSHGSIWALPITSTLLEVKRTNSERNKIRSKVDLNWTPHIIFSLFLYLNILFRKTNINLISKWKSLLFLIVFLIWLLILYLCILILIKSLKIKTLRAKHLYIIVITRGKKLTIMKEAFV